uniref:SRP9 domain-containing protein n=1 Tax=Balaenoptera musculus TaxID=9771 RepID=A0A8C0HZ59_BALMU
MPQYQTWEEFSRAAEKLYLADPMKARVVLKYRHSDGSLCIKVTDDLVCLVNLKMRYQQKPILP